MTAEYRRALTELRVILNYMNKEYVEQIPEKFMRFITENMDEKYRPRITPDTPINEQDIRKDTKVLLSLLYRRYWCDSETKRYLSEIKKILPKENASEKVDYFKEFSDSKNDFTKKEAMQMTVYEDESKFKKFFSKIKSMFLKIFKK